MPNRRLFQKRSLLITQMQSHAGQNSLLTKMARLSLLEKGGNQVDAVIEPQ